jgi:transposase-like protein
MVARVTEIDELMHRAAELRASGLSWDGIARALGRAPETVRRWTRQYKFKWARLLVLAEKRLLKEATAEAVAALRSQLRSEDAKTQREAAQKLLQLRMTLDRRKPKGQRGSPARRARAGSQRIGGYLRSLSDAEIDQLIRELGPPSSGTSDDAAGANR